MRKKGMNTSLSKDSEKRGEANEITNYFNNPNQSLKQKNNSVFLNNQKQKSNKLSNASTNLSKMRHTPESSVKNHFGTNSFGKGKFYRVSSNYNINQNQNQNNDQNNIDRNEDDGEVLINNKINKFSNIRHRANNRNKSSTQK